MYLPAHFEQRDARKLAALMRENPLATLVSVTRDGPGADHVPLMFDTGGTADGPHGTLRGHVARANPLWRDAAGTDVLAVFHGPQAYVTPGWYPSKAATGRVVPTWNYVVVHARGTLRAVEDATWLRALVQRLTTIHEAGRRAPWAVDDAPPDYIDRMLHAIVGIEITVTRLEGKWKVSQNRHEADRLGVADGLASEPGSEAAAMERLVRGG